SRKHRRQRTGSRRSWCHRPLSDEGNAFRLGAPLVVADALVGHQLAPLRPAPPVGELADMQEHALAAAVGRDEAEAFVVVPGGDSSLMAHGEEDGVRGGEGELMTNVVSGAEDKPGGGGPSA